jgi:hypothetical protein
MDLAEIHDVLLKTGDELLHEPAAEVERTCGPERNDQ